MVRFLFDLFVGHYAPIFSGALGIAGSFALAVPPIRNNNLRSVTLQLDQIENKISKTAHEAAKSRLTEKEKKFLSDERRWNLFGAVLLLAAFAVLFSNSVYCGLASPGTCH
jgi:hypothetical protein